MRSRNVILTLVLLLSIFLFAVYRKWHEPQPKEAFNRARAPLRFYAFALCRMQCLRLNESDIKTIMQKGVIHINQSNRRARPCPTFALQGRVHNQYVRVVFEQCRNATYVVTCYNLEQDAACDCSTGYKQKKD